MEKFFKARRKYLKDKWQDSCREPFSWSNGDFRGTVHNEYDLDYDYAFNTRIFTDGWMANGYYWRKKPAKTNRYLERFYFERQFNWTLFDLVINRAEGKVDGFVLFGGDTNSKFFVDVC